MESTEGDLYFKAVPPMFGREPLLTKALAEQYPMHLPELVAVDAERGWILMRDFGGTVIQRVTDFKRWEAAMQRYAEIQIEQVGSVERMMALGCLDRRLDKLAQQMDAMLADTSAMLPGDRRGLSGEEITRLRALAPTLKAMCETLAKSPIPYTLVHADFHSNNIAINDEQIIYYDWTDGCIAFPFFDLVVFLNDSDLPLDIPDARTRLRDAYLEPWTCYAPMQRLVEIFDLAYSLGALHHAVSYYDIRLNTEEAARWELEGALPFWLKLVLKYVS
jgi:aminoglycoside/choline kinase family phosphotransferase